MITSPEEFRQRLLDIQNSVDVVYTTLPSDEPRFIIDANSRTITIPVEFQFLGVKNDHNAETIYFEIDRYFDDEDLSQHTCVVQFANKNNSKDGGIYPVTTMDITSVDGKIIFGWEIKSDATSLVGDIYFSVRFYSINSTDYVFTYNFNTLTAKSVILDTLDVDNQMIIENYPSELDAWLDRMNELEAGTSGKVEEIEAKGQEVLTEINSVKVSIPEDYSTLSSDVSELKNDLEDLPNHFQHFGKYLSNESKVVAPYDNANTFPVGEIVGCVLQNVTALVTNLPEGVTGFVIFTSLSGVAVGASNLRYQLCVSGSYIYIRSLWNSGSPSEWVEITKIKKIGDLSNLLTNNKDDLVSAINEVKGSIPIVDNHDVLYAFKNVTCCGDSLTWSQVNTSTTTSRQAYRTYPQILGTIYGYESVTNLGTPGATAKSWWNVHNNSIVEKDNHLAIIYLGTNHGLTDTLDTDAPEGTDYNSWANTNTGCYAKAIAKWQSVGSKVLLVKIYISDDTVTKNTTNAVIEQCAERFGCAVANNIRLPEPYMKYPDNSGRDYTHYNELGYSVFAKNLERNIEENTLNRIIPN